VWGDKYPYNAKRFANLVRSFTNALWRQMAILIPKLTVEAKSNIVMADDIMRTWIKLLDEYRDVNWRSKAFPYAERTNAYL